MKKNNTTCKSLENDNHKTWSDNTDIEYISCFSSVGADISCVEGFVFIHNHCTGRDQGIYDYKNPFHIHLFPYLCINNMHIEQTLNP